MPCGIDSREWAVRKTGLCWEVLSLVMSTQGFLTLCSVLMSVFAVLHDKSLKIHSFFYHLSVSPQKASRSFLERS